MRCQHEGCKADGHPCYLPMADESTVAYCDSHAVEHGFCKGCGEYVPHELDPEGMCGDCHVTEDYKRG